MVIQQFVTGYDNFITKMENFNTVNENYGDVFILFTGNKLPSGINWCPNCVDAYPAIKEALNLLKDNSVFITVEVGDRPYWKDLKCPFRTNKEFHVPVIPTIVKWKTQKRLEGGDKCSKPELLELLFTDDED